MTAQNPDKANNLIWLDLEMTGLDPERDRILEIGLVVTDLSLEVVAQCEPIFVRQSREVLDGMDAWNRKTHAKSGLIRHSLESGLSEAEAERCALEFLEAHSVAGKSPMCGNSICQDRRFLFRHMPRLEAHFHYRNLDVSTVKEVVRTWGIPTAGTFGKDCKHEAIADALESIAELRFYLTNSFGVSLADGVFTRAEGGGQ